jgi:hypothetical protein
MYIVEVVETVKDEKEIDEAMNPYTNFLYALKSPEVRRQYPKLLKFFLIILNLKQIEILKKELVYYTMRLLQRRNGLKPKLLDL